MITYKIAGIRRFKVGKFEFNDGVCTVLPEDMDEWERTFKGLTPLRQNSITELNVAALAQLEKPVSFVSRGPSTAADSDKALLRRADFDSIDRSTEADLADAREKAAAAIRAGIVPQESDGEQKPDEELAGPEPKSLQEMLRMKAQ